MFLGAIADDITGATDLASVLMRAGANVILTLGVPRVPPPAADAIVVATKSRMAPVDEARGIAAEAMGFLKAAGADQFYFKYCSTFDSTDQGNIGPVTDYLLDATASAFTVICPSYPTLKRTVYQGHLFVADRLLSESSMRNHPLTPMTDPDIVRVLSHQTTSLVGLIPLQDIEAGPEAIRARIADLRAQGVRMAVADGILDRHIEALADACRDMVLVTGGAALGGALGGVRVGGGGSRAVTKQVEASGPTAVLSGSCSAMTLAQVSEIINEVPSYLLDPLQLASDPSAVQKAVDWAVAQAREGDLLIYSTADPQAVLSAQSLIGRDEAASTLEHAFAVIAQALSAAGVRRFVVAGGETSGAVTSALDVRMMSFGEELAPGVPWTYTLDPEGYTLALKSGNFGGADFFRRALARA
jgi:uncharacterized protein YgbK (DUF1537 family)